MHKILKIGHRGARGYEPENTLSSFSKALELDVDAVELDVYVCKTGELVVIHDDKVDRTTNGKGYVVDKSLEDLRELDAGGGQKIPLLSEVLDLVNNKVLVNIELKGVETAESVSKIIREYLEEKNWGVENFLVSSFDHPELRKFKDFMPKVNIGALITGIPETYAEFGERLNAYSVNLSAEFINEKFIDDAHKRGLKVLVWTVNDGDEMKKLKALNVDGMFSDFPDRL
jgi:glycerophosphoryl diester phosphodiesterase